MISVRASGDSPESKADARRRRSESEREFTHAWAGGPVQLTVRVPIPYEQALARERCGEADAGIATAFFRMILLSAIVDWSGVRERDLLGGDPARQEEAVPFSPADVGALLDGNHQAEVELIVDLGERIAALNKRWGAQRKN